MRPQCQSECSSRTLQPWTDINIITWQRAGLSVTIHHTLLTLYDNTNNILYLLVYYWSNKGTEPLCSEIPLFHRQSQIPICKRKMAIISSWSLPTDLIEQWEDTIPPLCRFLPPSLPPSSSPLCTLLYNSFPEMWGNKPKKAGHKKWMCIINNPWALFLNNEWNSKNTPFVLVIDQINFCCLTSLRAGSDPSPHCLLSADNRSVNKHGD